ncbi:MAG: septal ring lytic transglycosylase RlpA family protein [Erythrobacter sp.]
MGGTPTITRVVHERSRSELRRAPTAMRVARASLLFVCLAVPLAASSAQDAPNAAVDLEAEAAMVETSDTSTDQSAEIAVPFSSHFTEVIEPLGPDLQDIDLAVPPSAVDLDTFDPPLEQEQILRSLGTGVASYYGRRFHGRRTANGERFDMRAMTAAHRTLPFGSMVRVTNPRNGQSVTVRINDRGPFSRGRTIDLSRAAAEQIGLIRRGHGTVELELLAP